MRPILRAVVCATALAPLSARAEAGMCEYRHPAHPNWDFFASCSWSEAEADGMTTREVTVSNGSKFTTRDGAGGATVNGLAATKATRDDAACWRTEVEDELICVYPEGTIRPTTAIPEPSAPAADLDTAVGGSFGGGVSGHCLLGEAGALVEQGACTRRENCVELEGGASCLVSYTWTSGRATETATAPDWTTLDGAAAVKGDPGCLVDTGAAITFCWSTSAMTPTSHPILVVEQDAPAEGGDAPEGESASTPPAGAE